MISIIVPVYNTEKYLDRCIQSILAQTYTDFELLLVDDGSTDSSGAICDKYAEQDSRIRVFHKANGGASSARNMGLDNAIGEWVCFVDSDDSLTRDAVEILCANCNNGADIVIANTVNNVIISGGDWAKALLESKIRCELWGGLYKRRLLADSCHKIPASIVIGEDFLLNLHLALDVDKVKLLDNNIYNYNKHNNSSLVHSYKITLEHEKQWLQCVDEITNPKRNVLAYSVFRSKYLTLEHLVYIGLDPYKEQWVNDLMLERVEYKDSCGIKEKVLLSVRNAFICRSFLKLGLWIKGYLHR